MQLPLQSGKGSAENSVIIQKCKAGLCGTGVKSYITCCDQQNNICALGKNSWNQGVEVGSDHLSKSSLSILMTVLHRCSKEDWNREDNNDPG